MKKFIKRFFLHIFNFLWIKNEVMVFLQDSESICAPQASCIQESEVQRKREEAQQEVDVC